MVLMIARVTMIVRRTGGGHLAHRRPVVKRLRHRAQALQVGRRQHLIRPPPRHQLARQHQGFRKGIAHLVQVVQHRQHRLAGRVPLPQQLQQIDRVR